MEQMYKKPIIQNQSATKNENSTLNPIGPSGPTYTHKEPCVLLAIKHDRHRKISYLKSAVNANRH